MVGVFFLSDPHLGFWTSGFGELSEATEMNFAHGKLSDVGLSLSVSFFPDLLSSLPLINLLPSQVPVRMGFQISLTRAVPPTGC